MIKSGLENEVKSIIESGYGNCRVAMQGIGYKQLIAHFNNEMTLDEAIEIIKRDSRRYAKRQLTWFRRINEINWFNLDNFGNNNIADAVISYIISHKA
jgi:tRNA dimethylallyltransferase